jgi:hypothetical protein
MYQISVSSRRGTASLSLPYEKQSRFRNYDTRLRHPTLSSRRRNQRDIAIDWTYGGKHCSGVVLLS